MQKLARECRTIALHQTLLTSPSPQRVSQSAFWTEVYIPQGTTRKSYATRLSQLQLVIKPHLVKSMRLNLDGDVESAISLLSNVHSVDCLALYTNLYLPHIPANLLAVLRNLPHLRRLSLRFYLSPKDLENLPLTLEYLQFSNCRTSEQYSNPTVSILDILGSPGNALSGLGADNWPSLKQLRIEREDAWTGEMKADCRARRIEGFHGYGDDWIPVDLS